MNTKYNVGDIVMLPFRIESVIINKDNDVMYRLLSPDLQNCASSVSDELELNRVLEEYIYPVSSEYNRQNKKNYLTK